MKKELSKSGGRGAGKRGNSFLKDSAIMLLKKNVEKMSVLGLAIMYMKTKGLFNSSHYIYANKCS
jgi:hypothetical protein